MVRLGRARAAQIGMALSCLPWAALLSILTSMAWFMTDDAFITFRYVRNFVEGNGLVFNPGERVEGYSNFLWALELAAIWRIFGLPPEAVAQWLSVGYTACTIAAMLWWARHAALRHRELAGWMALGLVCSSATFAVWTSGGGLETRQFTFFVVAGIVSLALHNDSRRGLLTASFSLAGAALTRPEGALVAACCFGWFGVQRSIADRRGPVEHAQSAPASASDRMSSRRPAAPIDWRELACLTAPFVVLIGAHTLFRLSYYGEWLPNTYYAKHVRPWYESGFRYYAAATLETGLWLLAPLALLALREEWRTRREITCALPLCCIFVHAAGVMRVGGDHFEYRPLDFYWPALAVPAAAAMLQLGSRLSDARSPERLVHTRLAVGARTWSIIIFAVVLFYSSSIQGALLLEGRKIRAWSNKLHIELSDENAGWLLAAPGMTALVSISSELRRQAVRQGVAAPSAEHREFANLMRASWSPYASMKRGFFPDDAVVSEGTIGIFSYYLPDVRIIDLFGLTDAVIARNKVMTPNRQRAIAHSRTPPPGYLKRRGVNIWIRRPVASRAEALSHADFAVKAGPGLWAPFDSPDHAWVIERFSDYGLAQKFTRNEVLAEGNILRIDDRPYVGEAFLGRFTNGLDGWRPTEGTVTNHGDHANGALQELSGYVGAGFLTSWHPDRGDDSTGRALSPKFTATDGQHLVFLIGGGDDPAVGVRLLADGAEVGVWRGQKSTRFRVVAHPLSDVAGKSLQMELFDFSTEGWNHVNLDHVMLLRPAPSGSE